MKSPLNFLLYVSSLGLLGLSGWTVKLMVPMWDADMRSAATKRGSDVSLDLLNRGRGQGATNLSWVYSRSSVAWWSQIKELNLIGRLPVVKEALDTSKPPPPPAVESYKPLEEALELVSLVHDGKHGGVGGESHIVVRFKQEAVVEPPEWWLRENSTPAASGINNPGPRDTAGGRAGGRSNSSAPTPAPTTSRPAVRPSGSLPSSPVGREYTQKLWVASGGDERRSSELWPTQVSGTPVGNIRLVRVASDAQSAFFVRMLANGQVGPEQELFKTAMSIPQDVLAEMRRLRGLPTSEAQRPDRLAVTPRTGGWVDIEETQRFGSTINVGRADERLFREQGDSVFEQLNVDNYESRSSSVRGLRVRNVEPQMASRFGIASGDVLIEVNGKKVESKAQAIQVGRTDYNRGVRTFSTKWLSNGQLVERTYQAPDR
jgi:hypothetical protein